FPVTVVAGHAVLAVELGGREVLHAIQGDQVVQIKEKVIFQDLAPLQRRKDVSEQGTHVVGVNLVEDGSHLRVAGNVVKSKDTAEVVIQATALEGEQGRILEAEHGQTSHQGVGASKFWATTLLGKLVEALAGAVDQGVKMEVPTQAPGGDILTHSGGS